jgi:hypothetical protein
MNAMPKFKFNNLYIINILISIEEHNINKQLYNIDGYDADDFIYIDILVPTIYCSTFRNVDQRKIIIPNELKEWIMEVNTKKCNIPLSSWIKNTYNFIFFKNHLETQYKHIYHNDIKRLAFWRQEYRKEKQIQSDMIKFAPGGEGYEQCKLHFNSLI